MNIGMLCGKILNTFQLKNLEPFFASSNHNICVCVIDNKSQKTLLQKLSKNLKKGRGGYVFIMALKSLFGRKEHVEITETFFKKKNIPLIVTNKPYSKETINNIKSFSPDVIVLVSGFGIIKNHY